jgi:hypothetical protein
MTSSTRSTRGVVATILEDTYGKSNYIAAMAGHLAERIDAWPDVQPRFGAESREDMIRLTCWDWMSGGDTAARVARRIEAALS